MAKSSVASVVVVMVMVMLSIYRVSGAGSDCTAAAVALGPCLPAVGLNPRDPSPECCAALKTADVDCICSTVQATYKLPSQCNVPPADCSSS